MNNDFAENLINSGFTPFEIENLTKETILEEGIFEYLFAIKDSIARTRTLIQLQDKAKELKINRNFNNLLKVYQTEYVQQIKQKGSKNIEFTDSPLEGLKCGKWECKDTRSYKNHHEQF